MIAITNQRLFGFTLFKNRSRATQVIRQTGNAFCLDAAVQMLCAHYEMTIPAGSELRRLAGTTANGASMLGAKNCLEKTGFDVQAGQGTFKHLRSITAPAIAVVNKPDGSLHYVVVNRATRNRIVVLDPSGGFKSDYIQNDFEKIWTGFVLLAVPRPGVGINIQPDATPGPFISRILASQASNIAAACVAEIVQTAIVLASLMLLRGLVHGLTYHSSSIEMVGFLVGFLLCAIFKVLFFGCSDQIRNLIRKNRRNTTGATIHRTRSTNDFRIVVAI